MQTLHIMSVGANDLLCLGNDIDRACDRIDHRCARNADFGLNVTGSHIVIGNAADACAWIQEANLPQGRRISAASIIGIEGINAGVLGGDEHHMMDAF